MNVYGSPPPVVPLNEAASQAEMSESELITALAGNGKKPVIVSGNKRGVRPADLDEVSAGASEAGRIIRAPGIDAAARDSERW